MNLNIKREWLLRMAEKEANGIISVGGFFYREDRPMLKLWVWHDVLRDYRAGIAFALAETEEQAWEELKKHDYNHWWFIAGMPREDGTPQDTVTRPACYDQPIGFSMSGGQ